VKENEVAATCTTAGSYDSVVYCSVCKTHVISRTTVPVDALGHNYVDGFCGVCGEAEESGCEIGNHTFTNEADSTCNLCGEEREDVIPVKADGLVFYNNNLSFQEYIGIQPMLRKSVMSPYAYVYAKVVQTSVDGTNEPVSIEPTLVPGTTSWYIINVKVMSCDMTDNFSITLYGVTADGIVHEGATISTSVEDLALEKLQSYSAEGNELFCTILADMLNYGAAVQTAFNYHVSSLPNTQLGEYSRYATLTTPELINNATVEGSKADSISYDGGIFLSFQAQVEFQMLIKSTDSIENYELRVTDENGVTVCYGADCFTPNGSYYVPRVAIKAADLRNQYTLAIYNVNTNTAASKVYTSSIADQAASRLADEKLGPAVIAMMKYGDAVRAYVDASKS